LYKPAPRWHPQFKPGSVIGIAEQAAYRVKERVARMVQMPVVPVALYSWEDVQVVRDIEKSRSGSWWMRRTMGVDYAGVGSIQPMVPNVTSITHDKACNPILGWMGLPCHSCTRHFSNAQLVYLFRQHFLDIFLGDYDGSLDNWLIRRTDGLPIRIDHGWAFYDILFADSGWPSSRALSWHRNVGARILAAHQWAKDSSVLRVAREVLVQLACVLPKALDDAFLEGILEEFARVKAEWSESRVREKWRRELLKRRDGFLAFAYKLHAPFSPLRWKPLLRAFTEHCI
jgi:hypothetical protein